MTILLLLTTLLFAIAIFYDSTALRIPNVLCVVFALAGMLINTILFGGEGLFWSFITIWLVFLVLFPTFILGLLGAGDIKLMMAVGSLLGPTITFWSLAWGIVCGGIIAILLGVRHVGWSGCKATLKRYYHCLYLRKYFKPEATELARVNVPYSPALAAGFAITCYLDTELKAAALALLAQLGG